MNVSNSKVLHHESQGCITSKSYTIHGIYSDDDVSRGEETLGHTRHNCLLSKSMFTHSLLVRSVQEIQGVERIERVTPSMITIIKGMQRKRRSMMMRMGIE